MFRFLAFIVLSLERESLVVCEEESSPSGQVPPFVCVDGNEISLANVCDGLPHCPDASDETRRLCHRVMCPASMYRCSYGACVRRAGRCDGFADCADASDEFRCDQDQDKICSDREFQCFTSELQCVSLADTCNGYADCPDGSDENATICREYSCPQHTYRCSYGGCIHQEVLCDGTKDCVDGTDEHATLCAAANCKGEDECARYACREDEFSCENENQCVPKSKVCDGTLHCMDGSDESEEICASRDCPGGWFRCTYGGCVRPELKCNSRADCYDWSDEDESSCELSLPEGACRLPGPVSGTRYTVRGCSRCRPGEIVAELTRLDYVCDVDEALEGARNIYCQSNRWIPSIPTCPGNASRGIACRAISDVDAAGALKRCEARWGPRKGWLRCDQPLPVGTRVTLECPPFYERQLGASSVTCLHDGTWSQDPLSCAPICGTRVSTAAALIVHGWEATPEDALPWQATLFSHEDGKWHFFCGGTLIAERVVLTAGHCVWKTSPNTIRVALALFATDLDRANEGTQLLNVERIVPQGSYQDHEGNYGSDIAVVILSSPAYINAAVRPVCINWLSDVALIDAQRHGGVGLVAGMGFTENDTFSSALRLSTIKIVSDSECRGSLQRDFRKYLTYTSFCAGWANGTAACNGDSGGGLVLRHPNTSIWELHGIVSLSPRRLGTSICDPHCYTIFTKVFLYAEWIREIVRSIRVLGPPDVHRQPNSDDIIM